MKQAVFITYENRLAELRRQYEAGSITEGTLTAERAKALQIYMAGLALEEYRMNQITQTVLVKNLNKIFKRKEENE